MMPELIERIQSDLANKISRERIPALQPLVDYIQQKKDRNETIRLNFICTHNSRRSHLAQIWAQCMAHHFSIPKVYSYSGGTEATAMYPKVADTLRAQGFHILGLSEEQNPVYAIKFDPNEQPVIGFSKVYHHAFNPTNNFGAILTCSQADEGCPLVLGAEARFPITYEDPKAFDDTPQQAEKYWERSIEIGREMWWVFSQVR